MWVCEFIFSHRHAPSVPGYEESLDELSVPHVPSFQGGVCKHEGRWPGSMLSRACLLCFVTTENHILSQMQLELLSRELSSLLIPGKTQGCSMQR